ncbi:uncharacterized protein LOC112463171, partial [Temnothorax curvispinosus]|uniref:Uncharacterized protein LOC112463171 n=1 Tax=Temnothorax curvispinosus TaxID=300111 RepID=A0A6J1QRM4_9HYME
MANELTSLRRARGTFKSRLTGFETFLEGFRASGNPIETLEARIEFIQSLWPNFNDTQNKIEDLDDADEERYIIDERYCSLIGRARALVNLERAQHQQINYAGNQQHNNAHLNGGAGHTQDLTVKLPTMSFPVFDGNPEQWLQFRDSFQGLIETNVNLSDIQRMYYLRSSLKGRAAEVIQALESSAANYEIAWTLLKKRFEDKTAIASRHLQLLLDIPVIQKESGGQLRKTLDSMLRHIRAIEQLGANTWDAVVIHLLTSKLDSMTRREWRAHAKERENLTVGTLTDFLEDRCLILEPENIKPETNKTQSAARSEGRASSQPNKATQSNSFANTSDEKQASRKCAYCKEESHLIYSCHKFRDLGVPKRQSVVNELKLCRNCLRSNHIAANCMSTHCRKCEGKHNTLLHPNDQSVEANNQSNSSSNSDTSKGVALTSTSIPEHFSPYRVILSTARVWIHDRSGARVECRVLLDSGSQFNFITRELCERLKLSTHEQDFSVKGIGPAIDLHASAGAVIQSKHTAYKTKRQFLIIERITENLPIAAVEIGHLKIPPNINLADSTFHLPGRVDVILGASIFWDLLCIGQIKLGRNQPVLQKTHLGWIAAGDITPVTQSPASISYITADAALQKQVERFWTIEEIDRAPVRSKSDESCELHFLQTYKRDASGRFIVSLPFKGDPSELGESRSTAVKRFYKIEQKLERDPELKAAYVKFMQDYESLGHMTVVNDTTSNTSPVYYIPHHAVVTQVNGQNKLRVVFNASAKTTSGKSLNDILQVGPTIQPTLFVIVLRFRQHQFVLTADIVKMYRQVEIIEEQRNLQRIVWRPASSLPLLDYSVNTVTYGEAASAFLAIRSMQQAAHDAKQSHPIASKVILEDFCVDDLLTGDDDINALRSLKTDLIEILRSAGFTLAKWNSNEPTLLSSSADEIPQLLNIGDEVKTLGLSWASRKDTLQYRVTFRNTEGRVTKRKVLSVASQIFDPLGLVGPVTITAKILLQRMWQLNLTWDESLPSSLHSEWLNYLEQLPAINDISIPRVVVCGNPVRIELHGFSDASEAAYVACVYLRSIDTQGRITIRLLCAKSKVAPLKTICVPRLELLAALLLAKLVKLVMDTLSLSIQARFYWCNSEIVLAWIYGEPYQRKTFVANRITEIHQLTEKEMWHHVKSEDNPADVISRGVNPNQLKHLRLWWEGPEWLYDPAEHLHETIPPVIGEIPETKASSTTFTQIFEDNDILSRFSSLSRLKRVIAYCLRWKEPIKSSTTRQIRPLSVNELDQAMRLIIKLSQTVCCTTPYG